MLNVVVFCIALLYWIDDIFIGSCLFGLSLSILVSHHVLEGGGHFVVVFVSLLGGFLFHRWTRICGLLEHTIQHERIVCVRVDLVVAQGRRVVLWVALRVWGWGAAAVNVGLCRAHKVRTHAALARLVYVLRGCLSQIERISDTDRMIGPTGRLCIFTLQKLLCGNRVSLVLLQQF
jgi:hypothetical protein